MELKPQDLRSRAIRVTDSPANVWLMLISCIHHPLITHPSPIHHSSLLDGTGAQRAKIGAIKSPSLKARSLGGVGGEVLKCCN